MELHYWLYYGYLRLLILFGEPIPNLFRIVLLQHYLLLKHSNVFGLLWRYFLGCMNGTLSGLLHGESNLISFSLCKSLLFSSTCVFQFITRYVAWLHVSSSLQKHAWYLPIGIGIAMWLLIQDLPPFAVNDLSWVECTAQGANQSFMSSLVLHPLQLCKAELMELVLRVLPCRPR